ncbi:MAG: glycosyltransferase family 1 protein [Planctomycetota bacterium]
MRVGFDFRPALRDAAGIGRYAAELARALTAHPSDTSLVLFGFAMRRAPRRAWPEWLGERDVRLVAPRLPARLLPALSALGFSVDRLCGGLDLFHYTDFVYPPVERARRVLTVHDVAFIVSREFHERRLIDSLGPLFRRELATAAAVIVPSQFTRGEITRLELVPPERLHVARLGADHLDHLAATADPERALRRFRLRGPYILAVGTREPRKNHARLVRAFDRLARENMDLSLVVVGAQGWLTTSLRHALRAVRHPERICFTGRTDDRSLVDLYRGALFSCYPSVYEGFGLPLAEALRLGVPTLTSRSGALEELAGDAAFLVDPLSEEEILGGLRRLLSDEALRRSLGEAGPRRVQHLTWEAAARATAHVYRHSLEVELSLPPRDGPIRP